MDLDTLMARLYEIYEENNCDGGIPITVSTYAGGGRHVEPFTAERLEVKVTDTGEVSINIQAEDN